MSSAADRKRAERARDAKLGIKVVRTKLAKPQQSQLDILCVETALPGQAPWTVDE